jgi:hypothetical protein
MMHLVKSVGATAMVLLCNWALMCAGIGATHLMHAWGVACWIVFMDAVQTVNENNAMQEKIKHLIEKYDLLQEAYHREVSATELKHLEFVKSFSSHTSSVENKIDSLEDTMVNFINSVETSPQTDSSDSNDPVPSLSISKVKNIENKTRSMKIRGETFRISVSASPRLIPKHVKSLTGSGSCQF